MCLKFTIRVQFTLTFEITVHLHMYECKISSLCRFEMMIWVIFMHGFNFTTKILQLLMTTLLLQMIRLPVLLVVLHRCKFIVFLHFSTQTWKKRIINGIKIVVDFYKSFVKLSFFKNKGNFLKKEMQKSFQKLYWYKIDHQLHKKGKRGSHPSHWKRVGFLLELACHVKSTWIDETLNYHRKSGEKSCRCHSK